MSLLVWLPMTKDLTQQGLSDITVSNVGATLDNNGKLGKCYYFDGNAHYLEFSKSVGDLYSGDFSYAVWLKPMDDTRSVICSEYASSGASNIAFELSASRQVRLYWDGSPDISSTGCILPKSQWTHIAITRSGNEAKFYMNGELKYTYTGTLSNRTSTAKIRLGDDYRGGTSVSYMGYMNDFRIYDHALSPKEVEVLSRGLVCHYPLNGSGRGGDNIMPNSYRMQLGSSSVADGVWRLAGTSNMDRSRVQIDDGFYAFENSGIQTANDGSCYGIDNFVFEANTTYTMSMIARITEGTEGYAGFSPNNATIIGGTHTKYERYYYVTPLTTTWKRIYITFTTTGSTTRNIYIGVTTGSTSVTTQMALVKIEKGDKSTPWIPKSTDIEYTAMGYDSTTEYDVSGYGYNGTKSKTMLYTSNTARYSVATIFDGNTDSIKIPFNQMLGLTSAAKIDYTISVWTYKSVIGTKNYQTILGGPGGFELEARDTSSTDPKYRIHNWGSLTTPYELNKWNHFCFVHTATDSKLYVNGELKITGSSANVPIGNFFIGAWSVYNSQNYEGQMSDFRIYATALSAAQVAELYNTAVSVANNGTLMGYELVEG